MAQLPIEQSLQILRDPKSTVCSGTGEPLTGAELRARRASWREHLAGEDIRRMLGLSNRRELYRLLDCGMPRHGTGKSAFFIWPEVFAWWLEYQIYLARKRRGRRICGRCGR